MNRLAALMYETFAAGGYAISWATAPGKGAWRRTATAVLNEFKEI